VASKNNRIPVFLPSPQTEAAEHYCSRTFAAILTSDRVARYVNPLAPKAGILLINPRLSWGAIKDMYRNMASRAIPMLLPPRGPETLILSYPHKGQESNAAQLSEQVWMSAKKF
jgi:hypothetical protein